MPKHVPYMMHWIVFGTDEGDTRGGLGTHSRTLSDASCNNDTAGDGMQLTGRALCARRLSSSRLVGATGACITGCLSSCSLVGANGTLGCCAHAQSVALVTCVRAGDDCLGEQAGI